MIRELVLATALLIVTSSLGMEAAEAQPAPPATFVGTVSVDGETVADGTPVLALVNGTLCGKSSREPGQEGTWTLDKDVTDLGLHAGDSIYIVDVASDSQTPGCGTEGATVTFEVASQPANEQAPWVAGLNVKNLTVGQALEPATATPPGPTPSIANGDTESSVRWWIPAAGGGGAIVLVGLAAAMWRRKAPRREA